VARMAKANGGESVCSAHQGMALRESSTPGGPLCLVGHEGFTGERLSSGWDARNSVRRTRSTGRIPEPGFGEMNELYEIAHPSLIQEVGHGDAKDFLSNSGET